MYTFNIIFRPEKEGGYTVIAPSLPGCLTWAPSIEKGKILIKEAITAYLESAKKHLEVSEDDSKSFIASINLEYA